MLHTTSIDYHNTYFRPGKVTRFLTLLIGPVLSYTLLSRLVSGSEDLNGLVFALFALWSPLFFGIPALLMQHERDGFLLKEKSATARGIKLVPHLLLSSDSTVRSETFASLLGWFVFGFVAFEPLMKASGSIFESLVSFGL